MTDAAQTATVAPIDSPPGLLPHHLAELRRSALSDETIVGSGVRSETDPHKLSEILKWRWPAKGIGPGLVFPFRRIDGLFSGFARVKPDHPRPNGGKYEQPVGEGNTHAYFTWLACEVIRTNAMLVVTEGEKKALAIAQCGYAAIGLTGVWNWQQKRQKEDGPDGRKTGPRLLIPDLAAVDWKGRRVLILFDTDDVRKPDVNHAAAELARVLREQGADV